MKKIASIVFLMTAFYNAVFGQTPLFYSATTGVKIKYHNGFVWKDLPPKHSRLSMNDNFSLGEKDCVSIVFGKSFCQYSSDKKSKVTVKQIVEQQNKSVWSSVWKAIEANTKNNNSGSRYGTSSAGSIRMSAKNFENDYANQIIGFFNTSIEERKELSDTSIVLQKQFVSTDVFYFRLYNKSQRDYYIYIVQKDNNGIDVAFSQRWTTDDGEVSLVFCLPASSYLDINDFELFEDDETQYIPIATEKKMNTKLLQEKLKEESEPDTSNQSLIIGVCVH